MHDNFFSVELCKLKLFVFLNHDWKISPSVSELDSEPGSNQWSKDYKKHLFSQILIHKSIQAS